MDSASQRARDLREQIAVTEEELRRLKKQLVNIESEDRIQHDVRSLTLEEKVASAESRWPLSQEEYQRYGRQMIVPSIGIHGQLRLKSARILIVGAGGLGCPAAAYLAGSGVGTIAIADGDSVETSNLHRQILHSTVKVGMKKVDSAISYLKSLNPNLKYVVHAEHLSPENAEGIVKNYDLVLDCTDHPTSRYLISDICVLLGKPLVSASALRTDGQLIVLNSPPLPVGNEAGGPCYRCVFPKPPPAESVVSCGNGGILGPVVGVMGVLQALEAIKLISSGRLAASQPEEKATGANMLLFSAYSNPPFRSVKLRGRRKGCFACSSESSLTLSSLSSGSLDYVLFCGVTSPVNILTPEERIEPQEYVGKRDSQHLLLDVRDQAQFDICSIPGSINIPFSTLQGKQPISDSLLPESLPPGAPIYVVCRLGNDSQVVTQKFKESGLAKNGRYIGDIRGGLKAWKEQIDNSWPDY